MLFGARRPLICHLTLRTEEKESPCKFCVIHDLYAPFEGISVNSCIPTRDGTVTYDTIGTAIQLIQ